MCIVAEYWAQTLSCTPPHREDHWVGAALPTVPKPAGGSGSSDADPVWKSHWDPASVSQPDLLQAPHTWPQHHGRFFIYLFRITSSTQHYSVFLGWGNVLFTSPDSFGFFLQPLGEAHVGKEMAAKITFTNPLPRMLKDVVFRVEGLGLQKGHEVVVGWEH